jgi:hypothetical protein
MTARRGSPCMHAACGRGAGSHRFHPSQALHSQADADAREIVDMALLLGWLQVEDYGALIGLLTQPNAVPLPAGRAALSAQGMYLELVRSSHHMPRTCMCALYRGCTCSLCAPAVVEFSCLSRISRCLSAHHLARSCMCARGDQPPPLSRCTFCTGATNSCMSAKCHAKCTCMSMQPGGMGACLCGGQRVQGRASATASLCACGSCLVSGHASGDHACGCARGLA